MKTGRMPPLLTVIKPYVPNPDVARMTLRALAGALDQASRNSQVGFLGRIALRSVSRVFAREAERMVRG